MQSRRRSDNLAASRISDTAEMKLLSLEVHTHSHKSAWREHTSEDWWMSRVDKLLRLIEEAVTRVRDALKPRLVTECPGEVEMKARTIDNKVYVDVVESAKCVLEYCRMLLDLYRERPWRHNALHLEQKAHHRFHAHHQQSCRGQYNDGGISTIRPDFFGQTTL